MIVTGEKTIELTDQDGMSFYLRDMYVDNVTGVAEVGFSGENQSMLFKFISGKLYDFEGRYVDTYNAKERMSVSGSFNNSRYNYNINNKTACNVGQKTNFGIGHFYTKATNCTLNLDATIYSDSIGLKIQFPDNFLLGDTITGRLSNHSSNANIAINRAEIRSESTGYYQLMSSPSTLTSDQIGEIVIKNVGGTEGGLPVLFYISTNVGDIYHTENLRARAPVDIEVSSFLSDSAENQGSLISGSAGSEVQGSYTYLLNIASGNESVLGETSISLEYLSGKIGTYQSITGVSLSSSGKNYKSHWNRGFAILEFSKGFGSDVRASGNIEIISGSVNPDGVQITEQGMYFGEAPSVKIVADITGQGGYSGSGVPLVDLYEKTFTGCWDLKTGTNQNALQDYRLNSLTGTQGEVFYPHGSFGPGIYKDDQTNLAPRNEDIDIAVINRKTKDKDYMMVKLIVSGGHSDLENTSIDERIITGGTE